jgi:hypothetical protein
MLFGRARARGRLWDTIDIMTVTIKLGGPLRDKVSGHVDGLLRLDMPDGSRVSDCLRALHLEVGAVRVIMLGGRPVAGDVVLSDGDRLALFPPELAYNTYVAVNFFNNMIREDG